LIEPAVESRNDIGKLAGRFAGAQVGSQIGLARVQKRMLVEPPTDIVKAPLGRSQILARRALIDVCGDTIVVLARPGGLDGFAVCAIADDRVEPFADRHAGAARGFRAFRALAALRLPLAKERQMSCPHPRFDRRGAGAGRPNVNRSLTSGTARAALYPRFQFLRVTVNGPLIFRAGTAALRYFG